jgi:class 3 adenylate cyclase
MLSTPKCSENLPPIKYRISADYGEVSIAKSLSSQSEDLFGSAMNICAKINSKARPNGLVIGEALFVIVKGLDEYTFVRSSEPLIGVKGEYSVYHVDQREKRMLLTRLIEKQWIIKLLIHFLLSSLRRICSIGLPRLYVCASLFI